MVKGIIICNQKRVFLYAIIYHHTQVLEVPVRPGISICNHISSHASPGSVRVKNEYFYMQSYIITRKSWKCRSGRAVPIKMSLAHNTAAAVESLPTRATVTARPAGLEAALADRQCQPEGLANQNSLAASASELSGWPLGSGQNMYV